MQLSQWEVTGDDVALYEKVGKWFGCLLCEHTFEEGDKARLVYANFPTSPFRHGNFFVCAACDRDNQALLEHAARKASVVTAHQRMFERVAKQR